MVTDSLVLIFTQHKMRGLPLSPAGHCLAALPATMSASEVGPDPDNRSRFQQDSAFFLWTRIRRKKFVKNRTRIWNHFSISAVAGVCVVIS